MNKKPGKARKEILLSLQERAKELNCLYEVEEALKRPETPLAQAFDGVLKAICPGWQYPEICAAMITYESEIYKTGEFSPTPWNLSADIVVQDQIIGAVKVYYLEERPEEDEGPFLKEEVRLINTIAQRLSHFILYQRLRHVREDWQATSSGLLNAKRDAWRGPIHLLRQSDKNLYLRIARKMVNHLVRIGVDDARSLLPGGDTTGEDDGETPGAESNVPLRRQRPDDTLLLMDTPFELAGD
ncbi:MAG: hypothetical protein GF355_04685, partial [Candidatus Eisenbacteria bacterium]|nr:hypothetical protein [Candidatus Eisenbacteria bacterium]